MLQNDDSDIYSLVRKQSDGSANFDQVMIEEEWSSVTSRQELIHVKGQEPVEFTVRTTSIGPIINDLIADTENASAAENETDAVSDAVSDNLSEQFAFHWLFTDPKNDIISVMHSLMEADDLASTEKAIAPHMSPGLNIVYADRGDNIAMWAAGRFYSAPSWSDRKNHY